MRKFIACMFVVVLCEVLLPLQSGRAQARPEKAEERALERRGAPAASIAPTTKERDASADSAATKLPIHRVVLYKNGVGYFEHLGRVHGSQDVTINFTSGQLNDVLKSITILDLGKGRITGVGYNSEAPLGRRLSGLRLPLGERPSVAEFLGALRGARLEVRSGTGIVTGRLLSVERKTRISGGTTLEVDHISIVTDGGELRTIELSPTVSVHLAERDLNQEVSRYLTLLASVRDQDLRRMTISTAGTGDRGLYVSYISEVPIWKTTYRLVLPSKPGGKPILQGWAIVDNTVGEDWLDVELSLVAGAPQSFIQQLSQPYYGRRPVVALPESVQLTPQTHDATLVGGYGRLSGKVTDLQGAVIPGAQVRVFTDGGTLAAETSTNNEGIYEFGPLPAGSLRLEIVSQGFNKAIIQNLPVTGGSHIEQNIALQIGGVTETVVVEASAPGVSMDTAAISGAPRSLGSGKNLGSRGTLGGLSGSAGGTGGGTYRPGTGSAPLSPSEARARAAAAAQGRELGDLFEYKLKEHVTIRKNQSALVPIVQTEITADKVSLWSQSYGTPRPLRAVWVTNSSPLTLDGGSFSVLEEETFAGEGLLDPVKPGEKRLLSYAADLGVLVDTKLESEQERVTRVRISRGVLIHTRELREKKTYTVRNEATSPRSVIIEHPARPEWKLAHNGPQPEESSSGIYRFRLNIDPKKTATLTLDEARPLQTQYALTSLNEDQMALFLRQRTINPEVEQALRRIIEQKNRVAALDAAIASRETETETIFNDQQRLRENLKALKGSAEERALTQRYTQQLAGQETRLETLRREQTDLQNKRQQAQAELDAMVQQLTLDVNL
jgi:hypothetical protein